MNIGFVGLGKLGLPCALAIESKGHKIYGIEKDLSIKKVLENKLYPYKEEDISVLLTSTEIQLCSDYERVILNSEMVFVAVQTLHESLYEGITRVPEETKDFDYSYLVTALDELSAAFENLSVQDKEERKNYPVIIISTVLPGTFNKYLESHVNKNFSYYYNPFFTAMGTTIKDFLFPEFVLIGHKKENTEVGRIENFYRTIISVPIQMMSIISAELTKVAYNAYISSKLAFVNSLMEICDIVGANVDDVTNTLKLGTKRLMSPAYMSAGMGDGGGCHPRNLIALSWFAEDIGLSYNLFLSLALARESQTSYLAEVILKEALDNSLNWIIILGKSFKSETNIVTGSPSILLFNILKEMQETQQLSELVITIIDPLIDEVDLDKELPALFFIGAKHQVFTEMTYPKGSVILDPWGYIPERNGCVVKRIGRN